MSAPIIDGHPLDESNLDPRLTPFFNSGERIEVEWEKGWGSFFGYGARTNGRKGRFYIGKSTGWKPTYLMILQRDSAGGGAIGAGDHIKSIRGLGVYR